MIVGSQLLLYHPKNPSFVSTYGQRSEVILSHNLLLDDPGLSHIPQT